MATRVTSHGLCRPQDPTGPDREDLDPADPPHKSQNAKKAVVDPMRKKCPNHHGSGIIPENTRTQTALHDTAHQNSAAKERGRTNAGSSTLPDLRSRRFNTHPASMIAVPAMKSIFPIALVKRNPPSSITYIPAASTLEKEFISHSPLPYPPWILWPGLFVSV